MTDTRRPPACHYDRTLEQRVTREHRDDCENPETHNGCTPCTAPHCGICSREHLDNDHPVTCPRCISAVRTDLDDIRWLCRHLRWQAARGGSNGHLLAGAPIPGGDAMVMLARAGAELDDLIWSPHLDDDHKASDPVPPLLPLAGWAEQWRRYAGHTNPAAPSVGGLTHYLADQLTRGSQAKDGPSFQRFADDMAALRRQLEQVLHDERDPEQGVSCFECGKHLVRRFGRPQPCHHRTPARRHLENVERRATAGRATLTAVASYPELRGEEYPSGWSPAELRAARPPSSAEESAARVPCERCTNQGGISDPSVGQSWECLGCRKQYTPGEYANAVRADLLRGGPSGDGWTHISMAAEAASTMTGLPIALSTVRKWADRLQVMTLCHWSPPHPRTGRLSHSPLRLVFWPDVADRSADLVRRIHELEVERRRRAEEERRLASLVARGRSIEEAGKAMGLHPNRIRAIADRWATESAEAS